MKILTANEAKLLKSGTKCKLLLFIDADRTTVNEVVTLHYDSKTNCLWAYDLYLDKDLKLDMESYATTWQLAEPILNVFEWFQSTY